MLNTLILQHATALVSEAPAQILQQAYLYNLCMKAVWTTLGCCAAAAAPIAVTPFPLTAFSLLSHPTDALPELLRSATGLLSTGGPIEVLFLGVVSVWPPEGGPDDEFEVDEGSMGIGF